MRTLAIVLVLVAALVGVLFALGVFDKGSGGDGAGNAAAKNGQATDPDGENGASLTAPPPEERPELEKLPLRDPLHVLLLAGVPQRFNLYLGQQWSRHPKIKVTSWVPPRTPDTRGSGVPSGDVLPGARTSAPRAGTLHDDDVHVLAVHDLDPSTLEDDFWQEVAERVREGRLGLYVQPGPTHGKAMLEHPVLGGLLPVAVAKPLEGQPVPGTFGGQVPFQITEAGTAHPASRLVPWPSWSGRLWDATKLGDHPWGTKFAYPVEKTKEGAEVLLETAPPRGEVWPALIVSGDDDGRVLWMGAWGLGGRKTYGQPRVLADWSRFVTNWAIWLGGRADA